MHVICSLINLFAGGKISAYVLLFNMAFSICCPVMADMADVNMYDNVAVHLSPYSEVLLPSNGQHSLKCSFNPPRNRTSGFNDTQQFFKCHSNVMHSFIWFPSMLSMFVCQDVRTVSRGLSSRVWCTFLCSLLRLQFTFNIDWRYTCIHQIHDMVFLSWCVDTAR